MKTDVKARAPALSPWAVALMLLCGGGLAACDDDDAATDTTAGAGDTATDTAGDTATTGTADTDGTGGTSDTAGTTGTTDGTDTAETDGEPPDLSYSVPLQPGAPWPKFRRTPEQTARSPIRPKTGGPSWVFPTGKGIFSSPVIDADGNVYIGSADRNFYKLSPTGTELWRVETGEIIDSAGLLDDRGHVYFGSGDGRLRALKTSDGSSVWTYEAEDPKVTDALINWFEGNVAIGPDGTLLVPNDNFRVYGIARDDGTKKWGFKTADQTWSLPAVDPATGNLWFGNNNLLTLLGDNLFALTPSGRERWSVGVNGTIAASPLLTPDGKVILGGFDGYLRAYDAATGAPLWTWGARDHIYASPAQAADGSIIQTAADGSVVALDPDDGSVRWAFEAVDPIRSSPAIDGAGNIYVGTGGGDLLVLNPDGTLRFRKQLIDGDRDDLNASPALGFDGVVIAGESGEVFHVPYDDCLTGAGKDTPACAPGPELPASGASLVYVSPFARPLIGAGAAAYPTELPANQIVTFQLTVRENGPAIVALIDAASVTAESEPPTALEVSVSGDRKFLVVRPQAAFVAGPGGKVKLTVKGKYLVNPEREGLKFTGGEPGGDFGATFDFTPTGGAATALPLPVPAGPASEGGVFEMARLAAPLPTILPSYNQIGFDSLHYLISLVEGDPAAPEGAIAWVIGGKLPEGELEAVPDPDSQAVFPFVVRFARGNITFENRFGFTLQALNATLSFEQFTATAQLDTAGRTQFAPALTVSAECEAIAYGAFLRTLGFCNPQTDLLLVSGGANLTPWRGGKHTGPTGFGTPTFTPGAKSLRVALAGATLKAADHHFSLLLVDPVTKTPVRADYGTRVKKTAGAGGSVAEVELDLTNSPASGPLRAWLLVDGLPAAKADVTFPAR